MFNKYFLRERHRKKEERKEEEGERRGERETEEKKGREVEKGERGRKEIFCGM